MLPLQNPKDEMRGGEEVKGLEDGSVVKALREPEPSQTRTNCLSGGDSVTDVHMVGGLVASPSVGLGASSLMGYQALGETELRQDLQ